jgi:hypothetical protein
MTRGISTRQRSGRPWKAMLSVTEEPLSVSQAVNRS